MAVKDRFGQLFVPAANALASIDRHTALSGESRHHSDLQQGFGDVFRVAAVLGLKAVETDVFLVERLHHLRTGRKLGTQIDWIGRHDGVDVPRPHEFAHRADGDFQDLGAILGAEQSGVLLHGSANVIEFDEQVSDFHHADGSIGAGNPAI